MVNNKSDATNVEFAIKIKDEACLEEIKTKLANEGNILNSAYDAGEGRVVISTSKPWIDIQELLERSGYESALVGFSDESAVSILDKTSNSSIKGVLRFCSIPNRQGIVIDGVIDGFEAVKKLDISLFEYGDISGDMGGVYKSSSYTSTTNEQGRATIRTLADQLSVFELIGRGVCVSNGSEKACGVIARSAGIFQNYKRICLCSGKVLWNERDLPKMVRNN